MTLAPSRRVTAPSYPQGWFQVAWSHEVEPGQVISLRYFGRDLVLFRTASGQAQVLDAYCAHLGAHLGVGGKVTGERLRCPFHAWEYGVDGRCALIPYCERVPDAAQVTAWPTVERSGLVLMWWSPAAAAPAWEPPELAEHGDPAWEGYLEKRYLIRTSVQELVENIFDGPHFAYVHDNAGLPPMRFAFEGHVATARLDTAVAGLGGRTDHVSEAFGLGLMLNYSTGRGSKSWWIAYTPVDETTAEARFSMLSARATPDDPDGAIGREACRATLREFEKDIPIWEAKTYRPQPVFCANDGPIGRYRLWAGQFFAEA